MGVSTVLPPVAELPLIGSKSECSYPSPLYSCGTADAQVSNGGDDGDIGTVVFWVGLGLFYFLVISFLALYGPGFLLISKLRGEMDV